MLELSKKKISEHNGSLKKKYNKKKIIIRITLISVKLINDEKRRILCFIKQLIVFFHMRLMVIS